LLCAKALQRSLPLKAGSVHDVGEAVDQPKQLKWHKGMAERAVKELVKASKIH
jgi:hypothetical protein